MLTHSMIDPQQLVWLSVALFLGGEVAALCCMRDLRRLIAVSTVAEIGYVVLGLSVGGPAGDAGAIMHIGYQLVMRGLVVAMAWWLIRRTGSANLDELTGSGRRMPVAATLFGFGMFSVMGLSPFKGSYSKFLVLYAAIEQGHWALAAMATLANIIAAVYSMIVIQRVCLAAPRHDIVLAESPRWLAPFIALLAGATVLISLWPAPVLEWAEGLAGVFDRAAVPQFESPWSSIALVPYLTGFVLYGLGRVSKPGRDAVALLVAAATVLLVWFDPGLDPASRLFGLVFAGIAFTVVLYSIGYMAHSAHSDRYWFFLFLMIGSLLGLVTAHEFGNFYVFWELMTWTSYLLVVHEQTEKALKAGLVYFLMCSSGAYIMHFGILLVHAQLGTFDMAAVSAHIGDMTPVAGALAAGCFLVGFLVKAGFVPLHSWLPMAHPVAPSSISAPLSGVLTKAGIFGLVKVLYVVFGATALARWFPAASFWPDPGVVVTVLGCVTLLYGEVMALYQTEIKRMLAFSTLAQIGEIGAVLGLGSALATTGALLHVTNHAVMKSLLFFAAGAFILRSGRRQIADLAGLGRVMPFTAGCYAIATIAIMGLPPFSGFVSKFLLIAGAAGAGRIDVAAALLLGSVIAAFYYLRVVRLLFFHPYRGPTVQEAPASMLAAMGLLAAAIIAGGLLPGWQLGLVKPLADAVAQRAGLIPAIVPDVVMVWPVAAALLAAGAVAVWLVGRRSLVWSGRLAVALPLAAVVAVVAEAGRFDALSFAFALLVAGVGTGNMLYSVGYMAHGHAQPRFYAAFALMMAGLIGMAASHDAFNFFAFWELMSSWTLYVAIIHDETEDARREGFKYFIFNTVGACFMFLGITMLGTKAGSFDFGAIRQALPAMSTAWMGASLVLVLAGLVMKAAMLPIRIDYQMHPATAPTPISGYISAVLLKSGPWGVLKLFILAGGAATMARLGQVEGMPLVMTVIAVIAAITILYAGAMAMIQTGIKRLLIYSTVCQLGYVLMAVSLGTPLAVAGGLMHLVNHMLLKDLLFLAAGCIMVRSHATSLNELGGLGRRMPITFGIFLFAGLSLSGLPPLNGFASKWLIFQAAFQSGHVLLAIAAMVSSLFTLAAILKFAHVAFMGAPSALALKAEEAPATMLAPMGAMVVACVAIGLMPGLLLVPIAAIEEQLGMTPIVVSLTGGLPGLGGWHPGILSLLLLAVVPMVAAYLRRGRVGQGVVRGHIHQCGVGDLLPAALHVNASNLFEAPTRALRTVLHAKTSV
ncbi:MAG: proton-conducting transporter membrane subunit [Azospirillaceae bacterium]|nr:proton-conducting transporter membrane subunit [Azospirillaceae bacterium]